MTEDELMQALRNVGVNKIDLTLRHEKDKVWLYSIAAKACVMFPGYDANSKDFNYIDINIVEGSYRKALEKLLHRATLIYNLDKS